MRWRYLSALVALCWQTGLAQIPASHPLFDRDAVHEIRLRFPQPDWYERLAANYTGSQSDPGEYLSASFDFRSIHFDSIGVRFKGSSSYLAAATRKKPFRLKLNKFVSGQKISGLDSLNLSNAWNEPSFVREKAYYEMATALGLKAPRSNFAALYINGEYWGLYVLDEVIDKDFLQSRFGSGKEDDGNLYKGNIGATFEYLGQDPAPYRAVWEKQTNEEDDDWSDLIAFCKLLSESTAGNLRERLEPVADVDSILTALALDNATVNIDSYVGMAQNFNIYRRPSDGRWVWLVWDPSLAFGSLGQGMPVETLESLPLEWTTRIVGGQAGSGEARPLATKLWAVPEYRERYRQIYRNLVDRVFLPEAILPRMQELRDLIRPFVAADAQKLVTQQEFEDAMSGPATGVLGDQPGELSAPGLRPLIEGRAAFLRVALTSPPVTRLSASASALTMSSPSEASAAVTAVVQLSVPGSPISFYSVSAGAESDLAWLKVTPTGGAAPGTITVSATAAGLAPGIHLGTVRIDSPAAINTPLRIPVSLRVTNGTEPAGQPIVSAVVNAASYEPGALAPGEVVTLFGSNLGPGSLVSGTFSAKGWVYPGTDLDIRFDEVVAPILYASGNQTSVVVPFEVAGREHTTLRITLRGISTTLTLPVTDAKPGIFTAGATGSGQSAAVNPTGTINSSSAPAAKGSTIAIYFAGAGQLGPKGTTGALGASGPFQEIEAPVSVLFGGETATITYKGAAPGAIQGLYQVNAVIPITAASGQVPVRIIVDGQPSQAGVTIAVQ